MDAAKNGTSFATIQRTMKKQNKILLFLGPFILVCGFASCNTTKGLGEDLQKLGHEIEEEADEHL